MSENYSSKKKAGKREKIDGFIRRVKKENIPAFAACASFFLIMSFIPFVMFLSTLIRYTPLTYNMMSEVITEGLPESIQGFVLDIVSDVYRRNSALIPLTAITALWASGKSLQAITRGLNNIYHVKETRSWLVTRIYSIAYTLLFCLALVGSLILTVLGRQLEYLAAEYSPLLGKVIGNILGARNLLAYPMLFLVFLILYKVLPNRRATFRSQMPGAAIVSFVWLIFSMILSLYFNVLPGFSNMYGNMATLILIMMWLYFLMIIMLSGALINIYFETEFRTAQKKVKEKIRKKKDSSDTQDE